MSFVCLSCKSEALIPVIFPVADTVKVSRRARQHICSGSMLVAYVSVFLWKVGVLCGFPPKGELVWG